MIEKMLGKISGYISSLKSNYFNDIDIYRGFFYKLDTTVVYYEPLSYEKISDNLDVYNFKVGVCCYIDNTSEALGNIIEISDKILLDFNIDLDDNSYIEKEIKFISKDIGGKNTYIGEIFITIKSFK